MQRCWWPPSPSDGTRVMRHGKGLMMRRQASLFLSLSFKRTCARTNSNKRTEKNDETEGNLSSGQDSPANPLILTTSSVIQLQSINVLEVRHSHFNGQTPLWISQIDVKRDLHYYWASCKWEEYFWSTKHKWFWRLRGFWALLGVYFVSQFLETSSEVGLALILHCGSV